MWERPYLDYILGEMRRWVAAGLLSGESLDPIFEVYRHRRESLDGKPVPALGAPARARSEYDLGEPAKPTSAAAPAPTRVSPPAPAPEAPPVERNLSILLSAGSLLLLAGLAALVTWQWESFGRGILVGALVLLSAALVVGGERLREEHPRSARAFLLLGAALAPMSLAAANGLLLSIAWPPVLIALGLVTAFGYGALYRRTDEPMLLPGAAAAVALSGVGVAQAFGQTVGFGLAEALWLAASGGFFWIGKEIASRHRVEAFLGANGLVAVAVLGALGRIGGLWGGPPGPWEFPLALLAAAAVYGAAGVALRTTSLHGAALFCTTVGVLSVPVTKSDPALVGVALASEGAGLAVVWSLMRRLGKFGARLYFQGALAIGFVAAFAAALLGSEDRAGFFVVAALLWVAFARAEREPLAAYPALASLLVASHAGALWWDGWIAPRMGWPSVPDRWLVVPALAFALAARRCASPEPRTALERAALIAVIWAGGAQFPGLFGTPAESTASALVLLLIAGGVLFWSVEAGLALWAGLEAVLFILHLQADWALSPWILAAFPAAAFPLAKRLGVRRWLLAVVASHLADHLLPGSAHLFWPVAIAPVLAWPGRDEAPADRAAADVLPFVAGAAILVTCLAGGADPLSSWALGAGFAATGLATLGRSVVLQRATSLPIGAVFLVAGAVLAAIGFPHRPFSLDNASLALAVGSWICFAGGVVWSRRAEWVVAPARDTVLIVGGTAAILGSVAFIVDPPGTGVVGAAVAGACLAGLGLWRRDPSIERVGVAALLLPVTAAGFFHPDPLPYAAAAFVLSVATIAVGLWRDARATLGAGIAGATASGFALALLGLGYPERSLPAGTVASVLTGIAWVWLAGAALARHRPNLRDLAEIASLLAGAAGAATGAVAFVGAGSASGVIAATASGAAALVVAERRLDPRIGAWGIAWFLVPTTLTFLSRPDHAAYAFLAVALGLAGLGGGLWKGVRAYVAAGAACLIAVVARTLWEPLRQVHFGFYLTALGAAVLLVAFQFERRREQLRRWSESVRGRWEAWR